MALLILSAALVAYEPEHWRFFPTMAEVRCISTSPSQVYVAVPDGVYILRRSSLRHIRTLTRADGIEEPVRLCAYDPSRSGLLIATESQLYEYLTATKSLTRLSPSFERILSIGIASGRAYFDTDSGLFRKHRVAPEFEPVGSVPVEIDWYGNRDESNPRDYPFLVPYYTTDDQLIRHRLTLVYNDPRSSRVYVAAEGYGMLTYDERSGFPENHVRMGPSQEPVQRIVRLDGRTWFISQHYQIGLDADSNWSYFRTDRGDLPAAPLAILGSTLLDLEQKENVNALLPGVGFTYLGTDKALYRLSSDGGLTTLLTSSSSVNGLTLLGDSLFIGTDNGLFALTDDSLYEVQDPFGRSAFGVYAIAHTATGHTWFGALGGLLLLDSVGNWEHVVPPGFDLSSPVRDLAAAGDVVFYDNGVGVTAYETDRSTWTSIDATLGLPSTEITALATDGPYLWIASPGIVARLNYSDLLKR